MPTPARRKHDIRPRHVLAAPLVGLASAGLLIGACSADNQPVASLQTAPATPAAADGMLIAPVETLSDFRPLVASSPTGPNIVVLEGDPSRDASVALFRYTHGYAGSRTLHTHTATYRSVLIEGEMKHWDENGSEETATILRPGSYWRQPGGERHADHCLTDHCLALVTFEGPIDAHFEGGHP